MTKPGKYRFLQKYLDERFADTVVLTFTQIEDLLGFGLPAEARINADWWTVPAGNDADRGYADAWLSAHRTARPNVLARHVVFQRAPRAEASSTV
jgi:hypothetical protein